jgi:SAM-dependent methyltransferase
MENPPMADLAEHWNQIFASKADKELGWYEADVRQTLAFLDRIPSAPTQTIFLPGAGTSLLVDELLSRGNRLVLNDISSEALAQLRARVGERGHQIEWLHHDISQPLPDGGTRADIWIDRAVLHFLLPASEIDGYFVNVRAVVKPGGHVLLAEFSKTGAPRCAGLDVHRYSVEEMITRLGRDFALVAAEDYTFVNPAGAPRPYVYALFQRT